MASSTTLATLHKSVSTVDCRLRRQDHSSKPSVDSRLCSKYYSGVSNFSYPLNNEDPVSRSSLGSEASSAPGLIDDPTEESELSVDEDYTSATEDGNDAWRSPSPWRSSAESATAYNEHESLVPVTMAAPLVRKPVQTDLLPSPMTSGRPAPPFERRRAGFQPRPLHTLTKEEKRGGWCLDRPSGRAPPPPALTFVPSPAQTSRPKTADPQEQRQRLRPAASYSLFPREAPGPRTAPLHRHSPSLSTPPMSISAAPQLPAPVLTAFPPSPPPTASLPPIPVSRYHSTANIPERPQTAHAHLEACPLRSPPPVPPLPRSGPYFSAPPSAALPPTPANQVSVFEDSDAESLAENSHANDGKVFSRLVRGLHKRSVSDLRRGTPATSGHTLLGFSGRRARAGTVPGVKGDGSKETVTSNFVYHHDTVLRDQALHQERERDHRQRRKWQPDMLSRMFVRTKGLLI